MQPEEEILPGAAGRRASVPWTAAILLTAWQAARTRARQPVGGSCLGLASATFLGAAWPGCSMRHVSAGS